MSLAISDPIFEVPKSSEPELTKMEQRWFAVQTKPRHEKKVHTELAEKGIHSFLPLLQERRRWTDRWQWVEVPMFSQYLFVELPGSTGPRTRLLQTAGVVQLVGAGGRGTPIPNEQIDNLHSIVSRGIPTTPHEYLRVGERVRIRGGVLDGIKGVLSAIRNDKTLVVSVDLIQKSLAVNIDGFAVEPA